MKSMKVKKYSSNFERDYNFYLRNIGKFSFIGSNISHLRPPLGDSSVKEAFHTYDSRGKLIPCEDPELFLELMFFKKGLNFWIKYWAEGFKDIQESISYYLDILEGDIPEWVYVSFENQVSKRFGTDATHANIEAKMEMGVFQEDIPECVYSKNPFL